jgi:hypothetical protein
MIQNFFHKKEIPKKLPEQMEKMAIELAKITEKEDIIRQVYEIITEKYYGRRLQAFLNLRKMFEQDINKIWKERGFYQCTTLNYLIRALLVETGRFKDSDIKQINTLIWFFSPHQYLAIKGSKGKIIFVDPWSKAYGISYGNYAHGLHSGSIFRKF